MATTYEKIASTTLSSASSTITFSSISQAYTDLRLILMFKGAGNTLAKITFNNDSTTNYSVILIQGFDSNVGHAAAANESEVGGQASFPPANKYGMNDYNIFSYTAPVNKTFLLTKNYDAADATFNMINKEVGMWRSTAAINRIDLTGNIAFSATTTATLYGILKA